MDRPLDNETLRQRKRKQIITVVIGVAVAAVVAMTLIAWVRPAIDRSAVRTARVTRGELAATIEATGVAIPATENILSSPIDARVLRVLRRAGSVVRAGEPIVQLDLGSSDLELQRVQQQLAQRLNERTRTRNNGEATVAGLERQLEQRILDAEMARYRAEQNRKLRDEGLASDEVARESEVAARKASIEVSQLRAAIAQARRSGASELEGHDLALRLLQSESSEARRQRELATTSSDRDGVVTWVVDQEGATVRRGDVLARVADLSRFRIQASISDIHARVVRPGQRVLVRAESDTLNGTVNSVDPTVANGQVRFHVELNPSARLHNNQRVDVFIVTDSKPNVLKVRRGAFADGSGSAEVFLIRGGEALRRRVELGLIGSDEVEIRSGLEQGDEVITSDMRDYERIASLRLK